MGARDPRGGHPRSDRPRPTTSDAGQPDGIEGLDDLDDLDDEAVTTVDGRPVPIGRAAPAPDDGADDLADDDWAGAADEWDGWDDEVGDGDLEDGGDQGSVPGHRGAFGEYGGETGGLIERAFRERIALVGLTRPPGDDDQTERSLDELALLVDTAGADAVARVVQRRDSPDPATYLGRGKVAELRDVCEDLDVDTVVFDDELTPAQQFNLEKQLGRTAIDRTAVILDIFAQNAHSQEGKAQVELALLRYRLPRLRGKGHSLSQQLGARGVRGGPGETQTEIDRRSILRRIHKLEADLRAIAHHRQTQRKARRRSRLKSVAIVGYTNAGKSTLLNRLTDAGVLVEDRLFATLDATTRRLDLPGGEPVLVTDTVGFITKLPHGLVEAFKSTLELVGEADLLVHMVDASGPDPSGAIAAVHEVLAEIGAERVPELLAFNKADVVPEEAARLAKVQTGAVAVSAVTGEGVPELLAAVGDRLRALTQVVDLQVPYDRGDVLAAIHREGEVLVEEAGPEGMSVRARLEDAARLRLDPWVVDDDEASNGVPSGDVAHADVPVHRPAR